MNSPSLLATRRSASLFDEAVRARHDEIAQRIAGTRVLLVGGAGSIGSTTVRTLVPFRPKELVVVDSDENSLAELIRDLRGSFRSSDLPRLTALPIDCGSEIFHRLLIERGPFDWVLNFAALKHVRSEKDACSILQMLDTNVVKLTRMLTWLSGTDAEFSFFSVSTDKAANPVNLMGASKRLMEQVMFSRAFAGGRRRRTTSARFANVAFSDGSLLFSWLQRFAKRQPIACPEGVRRYFISLEEAGQICLLASTIASDGQILVPDLDQNADLRTLESVAREFITANGFNPAEYRDEEAAKAGLAQDVAAGRYPLLLTPLDTDGEKPYEEFVARGERTEDIGLPHLKAAVTTVVPDQALTSFLARIEEFLADAATSVNKEDLILALDAVIPEFRHAGTGRSLDERS